MFHVGQLVVCVDDDWRSHPGFGRMRGNLHGLRRGSIYTIREWVRWPEPIGLGVRVAEIIRPINDCPYAPERFRPVDDNRIAIFRKALTSVPKTEFVG